MKTHVKQLKLTALCQAIGEQITKAAIEQGLGPHEIAFVLATVLGEVINSSDVSMDEVARQIGRIVAHHGGKK